MAPGWTRCYKCDALLHSIGICIGLKNSVWLMFYFLIAGRSGNSWTNSSGHWYFIDSESFYHSHHKWFYTRSGHCSHRQNKVHLPQKVTSAQQGETPQRGPEESHQLNPPGAEVNRLENTACNKEVEIAGACQKPVLWSQPGVWNAACFVLAVSSKVCVHHCSPVMCEWRCKHCRPWPCLSVSLSSCACLSVCMLHSF